MPLMIQQIHSMQPAEPRAGDEGDPAEVQERQAKQQEELMRFYRENNDQPGGLVPADRGPVPGLLRALLRAAEVLEASARTATSLARLRPGHPEAATSHWSGYVLLVDLRREPDRLDVLHGPTMDKTQRTMLLVMPIAFVFFARLPGRARPLLGDDEPVGGRPGPDHAAADAEDAGAVAEAHSRTPPKARAGRRATAAKQSRPRRSRPLRPAPPR